MLLLDTSVLIDLPHLTLPEGLATLSAITYAELGLGIERAGSPAEQRQRIARRTWYSEAFNSHWRPFDTAAADGYAHIAAIVAASRPAHARSKDTMIAGHAYALGASLVTLNPKDFALVSDHLDVIVPDRIR